MMNLLRKQKGMTIIGQGIKIMLFTAPALVAAALMHVYLPEATRLPQIFEAAKPLGYMLLLGGVVLWATAVVQLLTGFTKGKLVTTGAYGVVRNPIYASFALFVLPAAALITMTWAYLIPAIFLYVGVMLFIGEEEQQLKKAFGREYEEYLKRVDRMIPLKRP
jgi:protein-S-isoprenylcysteine O-methyltransferase Ste14